MTTMDRTDQQRRTYSVVVNALRRSVGNLKDTWIIENRRSGRANRQGFEEEQMAIIRTSKKSGHYVVLSSTQSLHSLAAGCASFINIFGDWS